MEVLQGRGGRRERGEDWNKGVIDWREEVGPVRMYRKRKRREAGGIVTRNNFEGGRSVLERTRQQQHDHLLLQVDTHFQLINKQITVIQANVHPSTLHLLTDAELEHAPSAAYIKDKEHELLRTFFQFLN